MLAFSCVAFFMLLTLLVLIRIPLSEFPWVFFRRSGVDVFWGFGPKVGSSLSWSKNIALLCS